MTKNSGRALRDEGLLKQTKHKKLLLGDNLRGMSSIIAS